MRAFLLLAILAPALTAPAADPPSKRGGGFFGFGTPKGDQISADLFPQNASPAAQAAASPASGEIFRGGQPQRVEPVSYRIENGRRVEIDQPAPKPTSATAPMRTAAPIPVSAPLSVETESGSDDKRRGGILGFGRRSDAKVNEAEILPPVPAAAPALAATPIPPATTAPAPVAPIVASPAFAELSEETRKEKSGWRPGLPSMPSLPSMLPWKKSDKGEAAPPPPVTAEAIVAAPVPAAAPVSPAAPAKPAAAPAPATPAAPEVATFEIRRDEAPPQETKRERRSDSGILNPVAKIAPSKKEIDLSSAETIIQNGEIVAESSGGSFPSVSPSTSPSGPRQAPQVVNGVKTYSSWDDITAKPSSVADRLINQIR